MKVCTRYKIKSHVILYSIKKEMKSEKMVRKKQGHTIDLKELKKDWWIQIRLRTYPINL